MTPVLFGRGKFVAWERVQRLEKTGLGLLVSDGITTIRFGTIRHGLMTLTHLAHQHLPEPSKGRSYLILKEANRKF